MEDPQQETPEECPYCHGMGYVRADVPVGDPRFGKAQPCVCKRQEYTRRRIEALRQASNLQYLQKMTFETFQVDGSGATEIAMSLQMACSEAQSYARNPHGWLVFTGSYGSGKTHLAAAIANYRLEQAQPVLFVVVPDLLDYLRAAYAPNSTTTYDERFDQVRSIDMLILDDLGTQNATPWAAEKLYQLLNYRYNAELPTVITTNQMLDDLDPRLASRLRDQNMVVIVPLHGVDHRIKGKNDSFGSLSSYQEMTMDAFKDRRADLDANQQQALKKAMQDVQEYSEAPQNWLLIRGPYGVGKTHLAAAIANHVSRAGISVLFVVVADLLDYLRATFQPGSAVSYDQRFNEVRRARLLVLDDLSTQNTSPWAREKLFQILNHRYQIGLPTVLTVSRADWESLDERLKSRLEDAEVCTIIDLDLPSYRGASKHTGPVRRSTRKRTF
ncbi:MAG: ATP-binding protein [Chloroflexi bacterium]|nr:ATP-binding protein [Chloroflexota bacterium]